MSEKIVYDVLDFGAEAVKDVDAKLAILKFDYSWVAEVEREERMMKEAKKQSLEQTDALKKTQMELDDDNKTINRQSILDFGEEPVRNLDAKLAILKFNYSWVDEVEREERMMEEANGQPLEQKDALKQKQRVLNEENKAIDSQAILDFGEDPVKNLDAKLEILKFSYDWATEVEENERRMKDVQARNEKGEDVTEKEIRETIPMDKAKVKMPEKPQEVTLKDQANETSVKLQNLLSGEEVQEKRDSDSSNPLEPLNAQKTISLGTEDLEKYHHERQPGNLQQLIMTDNKVEIDDHFVPRRLFLFGIDKFKNEEARQINSCKDNSCTESSNSPNPLNEVISSARKATTSTSIKKNLRRRIKNFFGFK